MKLSELKEGYVVTNNTFLSRYEYVLPDAVSCLGVVQNHKIVEIGIAKVFVYGSVAKDAYVRSRLSGDSGHNGMCFPVSASDPSAYLIIGKTLESGRNKLVTVALDIRYYDLASATGETDPVFVASAAHGITTTNISNWNIAYGWGDHPENAVREITGAVSILPSDYQINVTSGTFSNVKVELIGSDGTVRTVVDNSTDGTARGSFLYSFAPTASIAIRLTFATANRVGITNCTIRKEITTSTRLRALKPDGTVTDINATQGGNLKISLEELENGISDNTNSQLRVSPYYKTGDATWQTPRLDTTTHATTIIDYAHHEIHDGSSFFIKNYVDLTNSQVVNFLCVTPNTTKWAHLVMTFASEAEITLLFYEGTTASNNGTPVTSYNRNRNSATAATTLVYSAPTVAGGSEGTLLASYKLGSTRSVGGEDRGEVELILKQNTKYLIRVTNDTVTNNWFTYLVDWYEHTNRTA